ncbi:MAG: hypothetical protein QXP98_08505 [Thermoproteus sp.]
MIIVENRRLVVLRSVVELFPISRYGLSRELSIPTSTVYYEVGRLVKEGYVVEDKAASLRPSLKGLVRYVELWGCTSALVSAFRRYIGQKLGIKVEVDRKSICEFLERLKGHQEELDDDLLAATLRLLGAPISLEKLLSLDRGLVELLAQIIATQFPAVNFDGHKGIVLIDRSGELWFFGVCQHCKGPLLGRCERLGVVLKNFIRRGPE